MKGKKTIASILVLMMMVGLVAVTATQGSGDDPLITLSYLTDIFKPQLLKDAKEVLSASEQTVLAEIDKSIDELEAQARAQVNAGNQTDLSTAAFETVDVAAGKTITFSSGAEVLLRSGKGTASASSSVGFIDSTDASFLENGMSFTANHLYQTTTDGRAFVCSEAAVLLVRGEYKIS